MRLPFLSRNEELQRLRACLSGEAGSLSMVYGRRSCGKSRLLLEATEGVVRVYYAADERDDAVQRRALAREIARTLEGFDEVEFPGWISLFDRWWKDAPSGAVLIIDEFPHLAAAAPEIPRLLKRYAASERRKRVHLILCGSSERIMRELLVGKSPARSEAAGETVEVGALPAGWICDAFDLPPGAEAVEGYSVWGGIPRYWELAREYAGLREAVRRLVLDPMGALHEEPIRLLHDELREVASVASILTLIGQGHRRLSEIATRLKKRPTSLSRPLQRLLEVGIVKRERPFGASSRETKRTFYRIDDPFILFWFRYVEAERSRLQANGVDEVAREIEESFAEHVAVVWKECARASVARKPYFGISWKPAESWWAIGRGRSVVQVDIAAESEDGTSVLVGNAESLSEGSAEKAAATLNEAIEKMPFTKGKRVCRGVWGQSGGDVSGDTSMFGPEDVLTALR